MGVAEEIRKSFGESDCKRDRGLTTPKTIVRFDNIPYGQHALQKLDLYRPKEFPPEKKLPVIISVHGGAWVYGSKEVYQFYCMNLCERGFAVVNFSYRLAPEDKFPAQLFDLNSVITWVLENKEKYAFDTENIFAVGDSAGAQILSLYTALLTNNDFFNSVCEKIPLQFPENFSFNAIALNCGCYDLMRRVKNNPSHKEVVSLYLPNGGDEEEVKLVDTSGNISENFPPVFLMTSSHDFLKDQAPLLAEKLSEKNVEFEFKFFASKKNKLYHVFHLDIRSTFAKACNDAECDFFKNHFKL